MKCADITGPLSLDNLDAQFCSDWLKGEIRELFARCERMENHWRETARDNQAIGKERDQLDAQLTEALRLRDAFWAAQLARTRSQHEHEMMAVGDKLQRAYAETREARSQVETLRGRVEKAEKECDTLFLEVGRHADIPSFEYWKERAEGAENELAETRKQRDRETERSAALMKATDALKAQLEERKNDTDCPRVKAE